MIYSSLVRIRHPLYNPTFYPQSMIDVKNQNPFGVNAKASENRIPVFSNYQYQPVPVNLGCQL